MIRIAATKAYTIGRRGAYKDYVDLYFILSENHASLSEVLALAGRKFGPEFNARLFLEQLLFLDDVEEASLLFLKRPVSRPELMAFLEKQVAGLKV